MCFKGLQQKNNRQNPNIFANLYMYSIIRNLGNNKILKI